jgi:hypothetical protein
MVSFAAFKQADFQLLKGEPVAFNSSGASIRSFCGTCGTSLFYRNEEYLPGLTDIHTATLDDPSLLPATAHIQTAERIGWMADAHLLPAFERFPSD